MTKKFTLAVLLGMALGASAAVPFEVTTVTDGEFAPDTKWYTMQIGGGGFYLHPSADYSQILLDRTMSIGDDADLWCFTGSEDTGFTAYNKKAGASKQLAAPANPGSSPYTDNGGDAWVAVKAPGADGYAYEWDLTPSTDLSGREAFYINIHGKESAAINKRGNKLAFWTAGKDGGSSVMITLYEEPVYTIEGSTLILPNGATISCPGGTVTNNNGTVTLGEGTWTIAAAEGTANLGYYYMDGDRMVEQAIDYYGTNTATITGPATLQKPGTIQIQLPDNGYPIFLAHTMQPYDIAYRIPSICTVAAGEHAGRLFAVNDYRYSRVDIGSGRIDLYMSYSDDNGATWTKPDHMRNAQGNPVAEGNGSNSPVWEENLSCGFGDPASVSDRETGEILVVACSGRTGFWQGRRDKPQPSARWWSSDGGQTWTEPDFGQWEQVYALFDGTCKYGKIDSQFIGSGRMVQSSQIKVGSHYRIYCSMSGYHAESGNVSNWVLYSDDFGHNWHILGGGMKPAVPASGDEPKVEELPDGSVLFAARGNGGNRNFNIFRYTDIEKGEGNWGSHINTNLGIGSSINACNGEIMIVPARNKQTGEQCYLALQSYPAGPGRSNVSIAWKPLSTPDDYATPGDFANWAGHFRASTKSSCYSTMTLQADNKVGFLFEQDDYGCAGGYNEIYRAISIEEITGDAYEYCADADRSVATRLNSEMLKHRLEGPAKYVGQPLNGSSQQARDLAESYAANPSIATVVAFNNAILESNDEVLLPEDGKSYRFISPDDGVYSNQGGDRYLVITKSGGKTVRTNKIRTNATTIFTIHRIEGTDNFTVYNPEAGAWLGATAATHSQAVPGVTDEAEAAPFTFESDLAGHTAIVCASAGTADYPAVHMAGGFNIVNWTSEAGKSKWYMEPVTDEGAITEIGADSNAPAVWYDLQGRRVASPARGNIYISSDRRKVRF